MLVVGVDESAGSAEALRWALAEARLRTSPVRIVHAWEYPATSSINDLPIDTDTLRAFKEQADNVIDEVLLDARGDARELEGTVTIERVVTHGGAAEALLRAARDADLLVVGSRGRGGFKSLLLGSVSQQCVQHATCPVVVVPARPHATGD